MDSFHELAKDLHDLDYDSFMKLRRIVEAESNKRLGGDLAGATKSERVLILLCQKDICYQVTESAALPLKRQYSMPVLKLPENFLEVELDPDGAMAAATRLIEFVAVALVRGQRREYVIYEERLPH